MAMPPDQDSGQDRIVAFLPVNPEGEWLWRRVSGGAVGPECGWLSGDPSPWSNGEPVVVAVPAVSAPVRIGAMPAMPPAQALAAERLALAGRGLGSDRHVAVAVGENARSLLSAVVAAATMDSWLAQCAAAGVEPAVLIPAALLLPEPGEGALTATIAGQPLARTADAAFVGEPALVEAIAGATGVREANGADIDDALVAAALTPPLDLRQGRYAPKRVSFLLLPDWRQLARMAAVAALLALALMLVWIVRLHRDSDSLEEAALAAAAARFPAATDIAAAESLVTAELARGGRGQGGFAPAAAAVLESVRPLPTVSLRDLGYASDGTLRVTVAAPRPEDINAMLAKLQQDGWAVTVPPALAPDPTGATVAAITVRAP